MSDLWEYDAFDLDIREIKLEWLQAADSVWIDVTFLCGCRGHMWDDELDVHVFCKQHRSLSN